MKVRFVVVCCLGLLFWQESSSGGWTSAEGMKMHRDRHAAVSLADGKVFVVGGANNGLKLGTAEIYDPATGTWDAAAPLPLIVPPPPENGEEDTPNEEISDLWAARLANNAVLAMGYPSFGYTAKVYRYTPDSNTWDVLNSNSPIKVSPTRTLLAGGSVLMTGGTPATTEAKIFYPFSGIWSSANGMQFTRVYHSATLLTGGRVLVVGGADSSNKQLASAEIYATGTGQWTAAGVMDTARLGHTATRLKDVVDNVDKVLVVGGIGEGGVRLASAEIYDSSTGSWSVTGSLQMPRSGHSATLLTDGKVLVVGGLDENGNPLGSAEIFDPNNGIWGSAGNLQTARYRHTATLLPDGRVLVAGGMDPDNKSLDSAEIYDPSGTVSPTPVSGSVGSGTGKPTVTILGKKKVFTTKALFTVKGVAGGNVTKITLKNGKKAVKVTGKSRWRAKVKLKGGTNKLIAIAIGPGGASTPAKARILKR